MDKIKTSELNYPLNKKNIAQRRYRKPKNSKLLVAETKDILKFKNLTSVLPDKTVLVINKSRVQNVRVKTTIKKTNGNIEIFILNKLSSCICECLIRYNGAKKINKTIDTDLFSFTIINKQEDVFTVKTSQEIDSIIKNYGITPLPPYISDNPTKYNDYISDFSNGGFSVAASTAGLHFDNKMIKKLINHGIVVKFINLDIGLGTFKPINTEFIEDFSIHKENYSVEKFEYEEIKKLKKEGYSIVAVGTTVLRVLETINITNKLNSYTDLFIRPGFNYKFVDYLITNFHAPKSSLLSIVLSIYGDKWKELYTYAEKKKLKFLSFGDAVLFKIV